VSWGYDLVLPEDIGLDSKTSSPKANETGSVEPFVVRDYVRWSDVDHLQVMRYDAYVRFFDIGEQELFRAAGLPYREFVIRSDAAFPRKALSVEYLSPSRIDECLAVHTVIRQLGTSSFTLAYEVAGDDGRLRARGYVVVVCVDRQVFRKRSIPDDVKEKLAPWTVKSVD
jgi:YbgC/YbaW family acyl-CoA thioester hydrolase